jgi:7-cyano-7-deazaguanine synthase
MKETKQCVLSLSGGMDSSTLLLRLLDEGYDVTAISFDYGQKHKIELERAQSLVFYINDNPNRVFSTDDDMVEKYKLVKYQVIKLDGLSSLLNSALVDGGKDVPEGHYENENMKETVVPNRNKIFSSITQAIALSLATVDLGNGFLEKRDVAIALGIHAGDHAVYPDCRQEFRDADMEAFRLGNWDADLVNFYTPYLDTDKFGILQDGEKRCASLGLNFNEVYKRTNTSYKPILILERTESGSPYNKWYSDYKSASSVERIEAFIKLGKPDPVSYADETGPVSWEVAKSHVEQVLAEV